MIAQSDTIHDNISPHPSPSQRTQRLPYPWLRRHAGVVGVLSPILAGIGSMIAGVQLGNLDLLKAFQQLGFPIAACVALAWALAWTYLIHMPRREAEEEQRRQALMEQHGEDRRAFLEAIGELTREVKALGEQLAWIGQRVEGIIQDTPTSPTRSSRTRGKTPPVGVSHG